MFEEASAADITKQAECAAFSRGRETSSSFAPRASSLSAAALTAALTSLEIISENSSFGSPILSPSAPFSRVLASGGYSRRADVASCSSCFAIASKTIVESRTSFVIGPIWSSEEASATSPRLDTAPYVGFSPTTPQKAAGWRIEPAVSEPSANAANPAATAAVQPPELPPGTLSVSTGFLTGPKYEVSFDEPIANSSIFSLPSITAIWLSSKSITNAL